MKKTSLLTFAISTLICSSYTQTAVDEMVNVKLNMIQDTVATLIEQSNIDPEIAQELLDKTNDLQLYVQNNIQQDIKEIRVAAAFSSILETMDKMAQNALREDLHKALSPFKYAARTNVAHKLIMGAYPGQFKNEQYYTNSYVESLGFIINNWAINMLFDTLSASANLEMIANILKLKEGSNIKRSIIRLLTGIATHYTWLAQKKYALSPLLTN